MERLIREIWGKTLKSGETLTSGRKIQVGPQVCGSEVIGGVDEIPRQDGGGCSGLAGPPRRSSQRREPPRRNPQHLVILVNQVLLRCETQLVWGEREEGRSRSRDKSGKTKTAHVTCLGLKRGIGLAFGP